MNVDDLTKEFARHGIVVTRTAITPLSGNRRPTLVALEIFEQGTLAEIRRLQVETLAITLAGGIGYWSTLTTRQKETHRASARRVAKGKNGEDA